MDIPLLYELVAARQIIEGAQVGNMPVVIVTHEGVVDPAPMIELSASRKDYVTRLSDYQELQPLLNYLLSALPTDYASASENALPVVRATSIGYMGVFIGAAVHTSRLGFSGRAFPLLTRII